MDSSLLEMAALLIIAVLLMFFFQVSTMFIIALAALLVLIFAIWFEEDGLKKFGFQKEYMFFLVLYQMLFIFVAFAGLIIFLSPNGFGTLEASYLPYILFSAPAQEFIFRGYLQHRLKAYMSSSFAVVLASAVFAASHIPLGYSFMPLLIASTFAAGLAWGFAYEKKPNLLGPALSHAILGTALFLLV
jgi:membrane protease YdiL (CAAX protease family)